MMSCSIAALFVGAYAPQAMAGQDEEPGKGIHAKGNVNPLTGDRANTPNDPFLNQLRNFKSLPVYSSRRNPILKDMAKNPAEYYISKALAFPEDDPTRYDILRMIGQNENYSIGDRMEALKKLPMDDQMRNELLSKWTYNAPIEYHLPAALALPENDPKRNQFLQSVAQDPEEIFSTRLEATKALSLNNPLRNELLYAWAQSDSKKMQNSLAATAALPENDPLRDQLVRTWVQRRDLPFDFLLSAVKLLPPEEKNPYLQEWVQMETLDFEYRLAALEALPADDEFRNRLVLEWAQNPALADWYRLQLTDLLPEGELKTKLRKKLNTELDKPLN